MISGDKAMKFCQERQSGRFKHQCVLDRYCFMERNTTMNSRMKFNSLAYNMATVQASEVQAWRTDASRDQISLDIGGTLPNITVS